MSHIGSQIEPLYLTLSDLKGQIQGHSDFEGLSHKGTELGHILLFKANTIGN